MPADRFRPFALTLLSALAACGSPPPAPAANVQEAPKAEAPPTAPSNASDPAAARIDLAALAGRWTVTGVAVGDGVGALAQDDPAYMGKVVEIGADRLVWEKPENAGQATLSDQCEGPVTARQTGPAAQDYDAQFAVQLKALHITAPDPHAVECGDGNWGPEAAGGAILFPAPGGALAMSWYDGAVLRLEQVQ